MRLAASTTVTPSYEANDGVATITINRPKVMNAFRSQTVDELILKIPLANANQPLAIAWEGP